MYYTIYTLCITVLSSVHACIILCMYRPLSIQLIYMQQELWHYAAVINRSLANLFSAIYSSKCFWYIIDPNKDPNPCLFLLHPKGTPKEENNNKETNPKTEVNSFTKVITKSKIKK